MTQPPPLTPLLRVWRTWDRLAVYLPLMLMGLLAMTSYWLVRNTPTMEEVELEEAPGHVVDYFMRDFSVKVFNQEGRLKSEMFGTEGRHYPDTDTLEIDQPRVRVWGAQGQVTTAVAKRGLVNADGSEVQLFGQAIVVREASTNPQGQSTPRSEMRSDFLHFFANTEQVRTHLPVELIRGQGDRFTAKNGMDYNHQERLLYLSGRVRGTLQPPPKEKK